MSLDSDVIVDRRRIRRKLTFWRVLTVLLAVAGVVGVGLLLSPGGRNALATSGSIARVHIDGLIRSDPTASRRWSGWKIPTPRPSSSISTRRAGPRQAPNSSTMH